MKITDIGSAVAMAGNFAKAWGGVASLATIIGSLGALLVWVGFGFSITTPLTTLVNRANAADAKIVDMGAKLDTQQHQIETQQTQLNVVIQQAQSQGCIAWQLLKDRYLADEKEAQDELNKSPGSFIVQNALALTKANVAKMDAKLNAPPCA